MAHVLILGFGAALYAISALWAGFAMTLGLHVELFGVDVIGFAPGMLASWTLVASALVWLAWRARVRRATKST